MELTKSHETSLSSRKEVDELQPMDLLAAPTYRAGLKDDNLGGGLARALVAIRGAIQSLVTSIVPL